MGSGTTGAAFLTIPVEVRAAGMGKAFVGVADDVSAVDLNPGGIGFLRKGEIAFTHLFWVMGSTYEYLSFLAPPFSFGKVGASLKYFSIRDSIRDEEGNIGDTFHVTSIAFSLAYGEGFEFDFGRLGAGISLKIVNESFPGIAETGFGVNIGCLWQGNFLEQRYGLGLVLQNLGSTFSPDMSTNYPFNIKAGFALWLLERSLLLTVENDFQVFDLREEFLIGTEYRLRTEFVEISFRTGYTLGRGYLGFPSGISFGFGIKPKIISLAFTLDYALTSLGDLGLSNHIGLNFKW